MCVNNFFITEAYVIYQLEVNEGKLTKLTKGLTLKTPASPVRCGRYLYRLQIDK